MVAEGGFADNQEGFEDDFFVGAVFAGMLKCVEEEAGGFFAHADTLLVDGRELWGDEFAEGFVGEADDTDLFGDADAGGFEFLDDAHGGIVFEGEDGVEGYVFLVQVADGGLAEGEREIASDDEFFANGQFVVFECVDVAPEAFFKDGEVVVGGEVNDLPVALLYEVFGGDEATFVVVDGNGGYLKFFDGTVEEDEGDFSFGYFCIVAEVVAFDGDGGDDAIDAGAEEGFDAFNFLREEFVGLVEEDAVAVFVHDFFDAMDDGAEEAEVEIGHDDTYDVGAT